jgi:4-amino-4-deoxy-L-arabinose transferase-like glycosyltransferase
LTLLLKAYRTPGEAGFRWVLAAGAALGLALLTSLLLAYLAILYLVVLVRRVWPIRGGRTVVRALLAAIVPLMLLSPWLAFNEAEYGSLTANGIAQQMQEPTVNPNHHHYTVGELPHITSEFRVSGVMAEEWGHYNAEIWSLNEVRDFLVAAFFLLPLLIALASWRSVSTEQALLLGAPVVVSVAFLDSATLAANWPVTSGRYLHSAGPVWMIFAFIVYGGALKSRAVITALTLAGTLGVLWFWFQIAPRYF